MKQFTTSKLLSSIFLFAVAVLLFSCANNDPIEVVEETVEHPMEAMYKTVVDAENYETRKVIFNAMTDVEVVEFWKFHISALTSSNNYTAAQLNFLDETVDFANSVIKEIDAGIAGPMCATVQPYFETVPETVFSQSQIDEMFTLYAFEAPNNAHDAAGERTVVGCSCSANWHCLLILGTSCVGSATSGCAPTATGCGRWGRCPCTGWCM